MCVLKRLFLFLLFAVGGPIIAGFQPLEDWTNWLGCISHHEAKEILSYQSKISTNPSITASIDLGFSKKTIYLSKGGIALEPNGSLLADWKDLKDIASKASGCYALYTDGTAPYKITTFSEKSNYAASLCPPLKKSGAPTLLLGGFTMHRISGDDMDPVKDTANKISAIRFRPSDKVLDTCMGLGYTAIAAAKAVGESGSVQTVEFDPASLEMACYNPWSKGLFDRSLPITVKEGDISKLIQEIPDSSFDVVIHDPPTQSMCKSDLYGLKFYQSLFRILNKSHGRLFHYIGNPSSKGSGRLFPGVQERLIQAGFQNVQIYEPAFGIRATTSRF